MNKVLITGGLGYLGGRMAKYFSDKGYAVILATRKPENNIPKNIPYNAKVRQLDYNSDEQLNEAMKRIDTLIHLAGPNIHSSSYDPENIIRYHVKLTDRLLWAAKSNHLKKLIYLSTIHVYGKNLVGTITEETKTLPIYPFAIAHLEAEKIINDPQQEIVTTILRCSNTFGAPYFENEKCWKLVVNDFCKSAFQNGRLIINSSGQGYRNFIAAEDVAQAVHHLLELKNKRGIKNIYNLGSSRSTPIIEIARKIQKELKNSFDYDCSIETRNSSTESTKVDSFILSTKKIRQLGFTPTYGDKEIRSLLEHCKMKEQMALH